MNLPLPSSELHAAANTKRVSYLLVLSAWYCTRCLETIWKQTRYFLCIYLLRPFHRPLWIFCILCVFNSQLVFRLVFMSCRQRHLCPNIKKRYNKNNESWKREFSPFHDISRIYSWLHFSTKAQFSHSVFVRWVIYDQVHNLFDCLVT